MSLPACPRPDPSLRSACTWRRLRLVLLMILALGGAGTAQAETCHSLAFTGAIAEVRTHAEQAGHHCYTMMLAGRATMAVRLVSETALVTVRTAYDFPVSEQTEAVISVHEGRTDILVGNPFRGPPSAYHLIVELRSYQPPPNWAVVRQDASGVDTLALGREGQTLLRGVCDTFRGGWRFNLDHNGPGLQQVDGQGEVLGVYFYGHPAGLRGHPIAMHYFEPELTHVLSDPVGTAFLDDFASSALMAIVNSRSEIVATFDLAGAAALREEIRRRCGV